LIEKLAIYADEIEARQAVAAHYTAGLSNRIETPYIPDGLKSVWAQYTLKATSEADRETIRARAKDAGVPTEIYYPLPLHRQNAYKTFPSDPKGLAVSEDLSQRVFSL